MATPAHRSGGRGTAPPKISLAEDRREGADEGWDVRDRVGDVEVEEGLPLREDLGREAVGVQPVVEGEAGDRSPIEAVEEVGEGRPGLLVLPRRREEHGGVDLAGEATDVERSGDVIGVVRVVEGLLHDIDVLEPEPLVVGAGGVALVDELAHPGGAGRFGVGEHLVGPGHREPGVEQTAGPEHARARVAEHRQGGDGAEARRSGLRHEQLGEPGVGEADHADPVVLRPVLGRHGLDHVVAVEHLHRLEEVVGPAGAPVPRTFTPTTA